MRYHWVMTKSEKIRARIARADRNLTFAQVDAYLSRASAHRRISGSHHVYTFTNGTTISIPRAKGGTIKVAYLRALAALLDDLDDDP